MTTTTMTKTRTAKRPSAGSKKAVQARIGGKNGKNKGRGPARDETAYLLQSPANAEHLRQAIAELDAGKGIEIEVDRLLRMRHRPPGR